MFAPSCRPGARCVLVALFGCSLSAVLSSVPSFAQAVARGPQVVDARVLMAANAAHPGSWAKVAVVAHVTAGYHINAHKPSFDYLIPTEVKFDTIHGIAAARIMYPPGTPEKLSFSDDPLSVYHGNFTIALVLKIPAGVALGTYTMKGKLDYQACNDRACMAPSSLALAFPVKVVATGTPLKPQNSAIFRKLSTSHMD
jgi:thioredoxin:protein disulfide reductase